VSLKDRTRGTGVKETMIAALVKVNLLIPKLTVISTDGAPATNEFVNGIVSCAKLTRHIPSWNFHFLIQKGQLEPKSLT